MKNLEFSPIEAIECPIVTGFSHALREILDVIPVKNGFRVEPVRGTVGLLFAAEVPQEEDDTQTFRYRLYTADGSVHFERTLHLISQMSTFRLI